MKILLTGGSGFIGHNLSIYLKNKGHKVDILDSLSGECFSKTFLPKAFLDELIRGKINVSEEKRAKMLWTLYCLEIWKKNLA